MGAQREHNVDEQQAARSLLWAASDWLEADDVLGPGRYRGTPDGMVALRARDLFSELLGVLDVPEPER